ncbi:MAG: hypothetical protein K1X28_08820 [Parachlamydiales bacterium]|nr:hypothetical protein [Parachlamydiales bacterium]
MKIEGKGPTQPNPITVRSAMVETPDIISSSLRPLINTNENRKLEYLQSVKRYREDVPDRVSWLRGGGEPDASTEAATDTDIFARRHDFKNPRNPTSAIHSKRVKVRHG